ncbi:MAG: alpha/beta hydrolase-fold protein [Chthonomonadales bacterium]
MISLSLYEGIAIVAATLCMASSVRAQQYPLGEDAQRHPGVPRGTVTHGTWVSKIFPGTVRDYWVYVPAQYTPAKPACVMVFQDGGGFVSEQSRWRIPIVFDNLIYKHEMPVTIGIFVNPGFLPPLHSGLQGRPNRSFEYDAVNDRYARFLIEEILPEVSKKYNLSKDPNDRAICGGSSGGICSFTAAWFRPDAFRRVLSFVGSFSNLRGGDVYPSLIRKSEVRPIRVFLQSGTHDMNTYAGSWYIQNQAMAAAFEYMGYDYKIALGTEGHNDIHGSSILPDALRWLWRDYPNPIPMPSPPASREWATDILAPGADWIPIHPELQQITALASDAAGNIYVADAAQKAIVRIAPDGSAEVWKAHVPPIRALCASADGSLYAVEGRQIVTYDAHGKRRVIAKGIDTSGIASAGTERLYATDTKRHQLVWIAKATGAIHPAGEHIPEPEGIALSHDGGFIAVTDASGRFAWSFQLAQDGSLINGEPFYRLEIPDEGSAIHARAAAEDRDDYVYIGTDIGIQVCDTEGRTAFIMRNPPLAPPTHLAFAGAGLQELFAVSSGRLFRRTTLRHGAAPQ